MLLMLFGCAPDVPTSGGAQPPGTGESEAELPDVAQVLEAIQEGGTAAMERLSAEHGFPVRTEEGLLVVSLARGEWQVAGDYNGWSPAAMECSAGLCWALLDATEGGYKFTDGDQWVSDPWSRRYVVDEFGELSLVATSAAHFARFFAVGDAAIVARTLHLLVPAEPITHVLYAQDGQNLFDENAMWGGWRLHESAPPGMLIVGIDNTEHRFDEYTHVSDTLDGQEYGGQADAYADFIHEAVRPLIRTHYGEPGPVGVLGSSLGGLVSLHIADRHPGEFAFAASLSGTLGWGSIELHNDTILERYAAHGHQSTSIYLDSGGGGSSCADTDSDGVNDDDPDASDNYCETLQMRDLLASAGYEFDQDLWHWWEPGAEHNEAAWAQRVATPLGIFAGI